MKGPADVRVFPIVIVGDPSADAIAETHTNAASSSEPKPQLQPRNSRTKAGTCENQAALINNSTNN